MVRNGGTHGNVSVNWVLTRNSSDPSPVTTDIRPRSGVLHFAQGQMLASVPLTVINDDLPEEAEGDEVKRWGGNEDGAGGTSGGLLKRWEGTSSPTQFSGVYLINE